MPKEIGEQWQLFGDKQKNSTPQPLLARNGLNLAALGYPGRA